MGHKAKSSKNPNKETTLISQIILFKQTKLESRTTQTPIPRRFCVVSHFRP